MLVLFGNFYAKTYGGKGKGKGEKGGKKENELYEIIIGSKMFVE